MAVTILGSGQVPVKIVSSTKTDAFSSTTTGSWLDVTGLSVTITPSSASNRVMVFGRVTGAGTAGQTRMQVRLVRDATAISIGDASGSRTQVSGNEVYAAESGSYTGSVITFLDSPATTSAVTYKVQVRNGNSGSTIYVNRIEADTDSANTPRGTSSITIMEISG